MKKRIYSIILAILICITASYSWIMVKEKIPVESVILDYHDKGTITIAPENIIMELWLQNEGSEKMTLISTTEEDADTGNMAVIENVTPNKSISFVIRIQNISKDVIQMSLSIPEFSCSEMLVPESNGVIEMRIYPGTSYSNYPAVNAPTEKYLSLTKSLINDLGNDTYSMFLYDSIFVPPTGEDDYVDVRCSFYFSTNMGNDYQGLNFKIMSLRALEI